MNSIVALSRLYTGMLILNITMLVTIIYNYAGTFSLLEDPFSWLGSVLIEERLPNTVSFVLFSLTLLVNAFLWALIMSVLLKLRAGRPYIRFLGFLVLLGFILMAFPCDRYVITHSVGAGLVVGGLWAFTTGLLYVTRNRLSFITHFSLQLFLHLSALFCGINFVLNTPLKGFSQRPLLLAIILQNGYCLKRQLHSDSEQHENSLALTSK